MGEVNSSRYHVIARQPIRSVANADELLFPADVSDFLTTSYPKGVGAGPCGLWYEHLHAAHDSASGMHAMEGVLMAAARGDLGFRVDDDVPTLQHLHLDDAGKLTPLAKNAAQTEPRPVVNPDVIRRASGRLLMRGRNTRTCIDTSVRDLVGI